MAGGKNISVAEAKARDFLDFVNASPTRMWCASFLTWFLGQLIDYLLCLREGMIFEEYLFLCMCVCNNLLIYT